VKGHISILGLFLYHPLHFTENPYQDCDINLETSNTRIARYGAARRARLRVRRGAPYLVYTMLNGTNYHVCK